ncbi:MAG: hypothetical protein AAGF60_00565 [Pseudomonadota bacterium]
MLFQMHSNRYQQDPKTFDGYAGIDQRALARVVGAVAVGLPLVLICAAYLPSARGSCFRDSLSHFYYAPMWGTVFTGALAFIGAYLIVYRGEDQRQAEKRLTTYAGLGAFGVALFPTSGAGCQAAAFSARPFLSMTPEGSGGEIAASTFDTEALKTGVARLADPEAAFLLFQYADWLHYGSALFVFSFLAWFCFYVFTARDPHQEDADGNPLPAKARRNTVYKLSGTIIVLSIALLILQFVLSLIGRPIPWWNTYNATFWAEAAALWAFGFSWLTKGRFITWFEDEVVDPLQRAAS